MLLMGKLTISTAIFNSYVTNYQAGYAKRVSSELPVDMSFEMTS